MGKSNSPKIVVNHCLCMQTRLGRDPARTHCQEAAHLCASIEIESQPAGFRALASRESHDLMSFCLCESNLQVQFTKDCCQSLPLHANKTWQRSSTNSLPGSRPSMLRFHESRVSQLASSVTRFRPPLVRTYQISCTVRPHRLSEDFPPDQFDFIPDQKRSDHTFLVGTDYNFWSACKAPICHRCVY